jgi:hypothetical protein
VKSAKAAAVGRGPSVPELIRLVRGKETQVAFARKLGITQSQLSKYEGRQTDSVPLDVMEECLALFLQNQPSAEDINALIAQFVQRVDHRDRELARRILLKVSEALK